MRALAEKYKFEELTQEKALYITCYDDLTQWSSCFTRIYFGAEFCEHLIPCKQDFEKVLSFIKSRDLDFTLVTPPLTNRGIDSLREASNLFSKMSLDKHGFEVVINDWGTISIFNSFGCPFLLGRLIVRQITDPFTVKLQADMDKEEIFSYIGVKMNSAYADFVKSHNVSGLELDNPLTEFLIREDYGLHLSLYLPFGFVTSSRNCHYYFIKNGKKRVGIRSESCGRECLEGYLVLDNKKYNRHIFLRGKTGFFRNDSLPDIVRNGNKIKRLVFEPSLPR